MYNVYNLVPDIRNCLDLICRLIRSQAGNIQYSNLGMAKFFSQQWQMSNALEILKEIMVQVVEKMCSWKISKFLALKVENILLKD